MTACSRKTIYDSYQHIALWYGSLVEEKETILFLMHIDVRFCHRNWRRLQMKSKTSHMNS
uniref:Uncharacterized protein n=1 Tax=Arundo donax TaxID=35708 RepID=A0A0A9AP51_ARUDO